MFSFVLSAIAFALSTNAYAVTIANMVSYYDAPSRRLMMMPLLFGLFQGLMAVIGYLFGSLASPFMNEFPKLVPAAIIIFIGVRMVRDGIRELRLGRSGAERADQPDSASGGELTMSMLFMQAFAISVNSFIIGISFVALGITLGTAGAAIAVMTTASCVIAVQMGPRANIILGDASVVFGGLILIGVAAWVFFS